MKLLLFVFLAFASAGPLEKLIQKVATPSLSLLQRCLDGKPVLLDMENLPGKDRAAGDPCSEDAQCRTGLRCSCQAHGGKECATQCVVQDVVIPPDGEFHDVHCSMRCKCTETGEIACLDMCPPVAIDCQRGQNPVMLPPPEGQCCGTPTCSAYQPLAEDCATEDVTAALTFPDDTIQKYAIGTAQVDVGLGARCCVSSHNACGSKSYTAPYPWVISKENYLKASGFASIARIQALGLILIHPNPDTQPPPVKLGTDVTSVVLQGGGSCGEGRILADLAGDDGVYGDVHNGPRFDTLSLSFQQCETLCDNYSGCAGFSWKAERGLHLDGNCLMRDTACSASGTVTTGMKFYVKNEDA